MGRFHFIEIHEQRWCPRAIREGVTGFLQFSVERTRHYAAAVPRIRQALNRLGISRIVDLCSGAGGPWLNLCRELDEGDGEPVQVWLTDKCPDTAAYRRMGERSGGRIRFVEDSVDAANMPAGLDGFRTLFTSFHHFQPGEAVAILRNAVDNRQGIGVFEFTGRGPLALFFMLGSPTMVLLWTPFIRPFRWSRLFWTYLVPLIPLVTLFDSIVSCLRTYSPRELRRLVDGLDTEGYEWKVGQERAAFPPIPITYLIGLPKAED